jgi:hypothetical protein
LVDDIRAGPAESDDRYGDRDSRPVAPADLLADLRLLWAESASQFRGIGELAFLELDLATSSLLKMLAAVLVVAGLALSTWLLLVALLAFLLVAGGLSVPMALLAAALLNLVAAAILALFIRSLARDTQFRNLRRYLAARENREAAAPQQ